MIRIIIVIRIINWENVAKDAKTQTHTICLAPGALRVQIWNVKSLIN